MGNESYKQVMSFQYKRTKDNFDGQTNYSIGNEEHKISPWNHPASLANKILKWVKHTYFFGMMIVGPMGHGKTSIAQCIAHFLHLKDPSFEIRWAGAHEFRHQEI